MPPTQDTGSTAPPTCALCGHDMFLMNCGESGTTAQGQHVNLCHTDNHSCYNLWTHGGYRPKGWPDPVGIYKTYTPGAPTPPLKHTAEEPHYHSNQGDTPCPHPVQECMSSLPASASLTYTKPSLLAKYTAPMYLSLHTSDPASTPAPAPAPAKHYHAGSEHPCLKPGCPALSAKPVSTPHKTKPPGAHKPIQWAKPSSPTNCWFQSTKDPMHFEIFPAKKMNELQAALALVNSKIKKVPFYASLTEHMDGTGWLLEDRVPFPPETNQDGPERVILLLAASLPDAYEFLQRYRPELPCKPETGEIRVLTTGTTHQAAGHPANRVVATPLARKDPNFYNHMVKLCERLA